MAIVLKGGLDGFTGFESLVGTVSDYEVEAQKAATKLGDSKLLLSAAWSARGDTYVEYSDAAYHYGRHGENEGNFAYWRDVCLHYVTEMREAEGLIPGFQWRVNEDTIALIEVMGRWYDELASRTKRNRVWSNECQRFAKLHREFVRRFWEYKKLLGKEVPAIA